MTNAHDIIAAKRAEIAERKRIHEIEGRAIELDDAELAGMEKVAHLFGPAPRAVLGGIRPSISQRVNHGGGESKPSHGRQKGAISKRWRRVLAYALLLEDDWIHPSRFVEIIKSLEGRDTTPPHVRRILDGYAESGFVEANSEGLYRVTETARSKFALGESSAVDALKENEPRSETAGGSDAEVWVVDAAQSSRIDPFS